MVGDKSERVSTYLLYNNFSGGSDPAAESFI